MSFVTPLVLTFPYKIASHNVSISDMCLIYCHTIGEGAGGVTRVKRDRKITRAT